MSSAPSAVKTRSVPGAASGSVATQTLPTKAGGLATTFWAKAGASTPASVTANTSDPIHGRNT